jgi:putative proteasome-type protease
MTYCVGVKLDEGMVFAADTRTHAGVDNYSKFCKMTVFERAGDRVIVLLSSGNLAGTQAVIGVLNQRCAEESGSANLWTAKTMFDGATLVADAMRDIERRDGKFLEQSYIAFNASFIVGGHVRGEDHAFVEFHADTVGHERASIRIRHPPASHIQVDGSRSNDGCGGHVGWSAACTDGSFASRR